MLLERLGALADPGREGVLPAALAVAGTASREAAGAATAGDVTWVLVAVISLLGELALFVEAACAAGGLPPAAGL